ncbi:MAG: LPP20 family lipoprotein [Sideroxydans sp.]|nr:LPP20 family lipoprotein [Sideroxydans sp.]
MTNRYVMSLLALGMLGLGGCASAPKVAAPECVFPNSQQAAPLWVCNMPVEGTSVTAVGMAAKSAAGMSFMKQMAMTEARVQLAQTIRTRVTNMVKQYAESTGSADQETVDQVNTSVTKQITDEMLVGSKLLRTITGPDGTLYALVGLDEASAQQLAATALKSSMNNDQAAWQQFRSQKSQDELATEIANQPPAQ